MEENRLLCEDLDTIIKVERHKNKKGQEFIVFYPEKEPTYFAIYNLSSIFNYDLESLMEHFDAAEKRVFFLSSYDPCFNIVTNHYITYINAERLYYQKEIDIESIHQFFRIPLDAILNSVCRYRTAQGNLRPCFV